MNGHHSVCKCIFKRNSLSIISPQLCLLLISSAKGGWYSWRDCFITRRSWEISPCSCISGTTSGCLLLDTKWFSFLFFSRQRKLSSSKWGFQITWETSSCFFPLSFLEDLFCKILPASSLFSKAQLLLAIAEPSCSCVLCTGWILLFTVMLFVLMVVPWRLRVLCSVVMVWDKAV